MLCSCAVVYLTAFCGTIISMSGKNRYKCIHFSKNMYNKDNAMIILLQKSR